MINYLNIISNKEIANYSRKRKYEKKLGEVCKTITGVDIKKELKQSTARFVLIGLPEDIGVRANFGRRGAYSAWQPTLNSLLNTQSNSFFKGDELLVLGSVNFNDLMNEAQDLMPENPLHLKRLRELTQQIDERVTWIVSEIINANKIPLIIGGGHNNSYGNIMGSFKALKTKINVINCDAHSDFRPLEGRHSGNGFSYAYDQKALNKYFIIGLHESYNSNTVLNKINKNPDILYHTFEDIFIREKLSFKEAVSHAIQFVKDAPCGIEIDMDAIQNIPSSAKTSSGISANVARQYVYWCAKQLNVCYLHIAEAAPVLSHIKADNKTGKLISYLLIDFMKGVLEHSES
jgi:formiminoglutamase